MGITRHRANEGEKLKFLPFDLDDLSSGFPSNATLLQTK